MADQRNTLYSSETEIQVISACLFEVNIFHYVQEYLSEDLFTDYDCVKAYNVMMQLVAEGKEPDMMEVDARLRKQNSNVLKFVTDGGSASEITKQRVFFLSELSLRRKLTALFYKGQVMASDVTLTIEDIQQLFKEFDKVFNNTTGSDILSIGDVLKSLINDVALRKEDKGTSGMMTGLHIFDARFGWHGGDLIIIAAETSQGKTTLATTIAFNMAVGGVPLVFYSMEMSAKQLTARLIARQTQVSSSSTLYSKLSDDEYNKLYDGSLSLKSLPIYFDEDNKNNFSKICSSIRRMVKQHGIKVVFIDYLQILANGSRENREAIIGDMARDLKRLAVELDIAICALSQLKRAEGSKEPALNRMRGSGQIEEACDMAILIHRPNLKTDVANVTIAKGRNIGLAKEKVKFNSALSYFSDFEQGDPQAPYQERKEELPF